LKNGGKACVEVKIITNIKDTAEELTQKLVSGQQSHNAGV
jgi:hypothetical protein